MKHFLKTGLVGISLVATTAFAAGPSNFHNVGLLEVGGAYAFITGNQGNPDSCPNPGKYVISRTADNYKDVLAAMLTAKAAGLETQFFLSGCSTGPGSFSHPVILSVRNR